MTHNQGKRIGGDFLNKIKKIVPRLEIREFIYQNVLKKNIINLSKRDVNIVMLRFKLHDKDRNKIKKMIDVILHRNNDNLPPIKYRKNQFDNYQELHSLTRNKNLLAIEWIHDDNTKSTDLMQTN